MILGNHLATLLLHELRSWKRIDVKIVMTFFVFSSRLVTGFSEAVLLDSQDFSKTL